MPDLFDRAVDLLGDVTSPWGYLIVFGAAFAEGGLLLGLVFPGETIMLVAGFLAWRGDANVVGLVAAAILGAVVGDSVGYWLGHHLGPKVRDSAAGRKLGEDRWARGEEYMRTKGWKAVVLARWVTGPKSIVPILAGQSRMPYLRFLAFNAAGAVAWGTFHVGIGFVLGPSVRAVDKWLGRAGWALLGLAVVAAIGWYLWRRRHRHDEDDDGGDEAAATSPTSAAPR